MPEGKIAQLQRERDEAKKDFDDARAQRDACFLRAQKLREENVQVQTWLQDAICTGNVAQAQTARERLSVINKLREEELNTAELLKHRQHRLQHEFSEAHIKSKNAESDAARFARLIVDVREKMAKAQQRGDESPRVNAWRMDLQQYESRYCDLIGEPPAESSVAA